jgi:hypothetical protein
MHANQKFTLGLIGLILISCFGCAIFGLVAYPTFREPVSVEQYNPVVAPTVTSDKPLIDQLGPEQHFPGMVQGPAVAEIWDGAQYCALVKVNSGETLNWNHPGAYWVAASQEVLVVRFPAHKVEYNKNYPNCSVLLSAYDVPNPTK